MGVKLGNLLREHRKRLGLTLAAVGDELGISYAAVQQWESGKTSPSFARLSKLAPLYGLDENLLMRYVSLEMDVDNPSAPSVNGGGQGAEKLDMLASSIEKKAIIPAPGLPPKRELHNVADLLPAREDLPRDLPVLGVAVGGDDADFSFNGETVDYLRRPVGLAHVRGAYAVFVVNDSMHPRFDDGDIVFVNPDRKPMIGDDVIIEFNDDGDGGRALLKRLVKTTSRCLTVRQFNPDKTFEIERDDIKQVHRVVPPRELIGV